MLDTPEALERQIHRIHELLECSTDEVTWNDYIPDPDNPSQFLAKATLHLSNAD
jgi:hypothetical protein